MTGEVQTRPVLFLDRDGVLIENRPDYVRAWHDIAIIPAAVIACQQITDAGYGIVVVSNQAGVGRGIVSLETMLSLNENILDAFRQRGANILAGYTCPHHPDDGCECRKPKPGMLLQAAKDWQINLAQSVMVGDALRDLQAAHAAGVNGKLVRTGMGVDEESRVNESGNGNWAVYNDLLEAVPFILNDLSGGN